MHVVIESQHTYKQTYLKTLILTNIQTHACMLTLDMPIPQLSRQSTYIPTHMQTTFVPIKVNTHILTNMYTHARMLTLNIPIPVTQLPQQWRQATTATLISTSTTFKSLGVLQSVVDCCSALRTVAVCCRLGSRPRRQLKPRRCCSELQTVADIQISHIYVSRSVSLLQSVADIQISHIHVSRSVSLLQSVADIQNSHGPLSRFFFVMNQL